VQLVVNTNFWFSFDEIIELSLNIMYVLIERKERRHIIIDLGENI